MNIKKRIDYLDAVKGVGIILVVYAHNQSPLVKIIYTFHMPLFFLIAGIFFKEYGSYFEFFLTRYFGQMKELNTPPLKTLLGIFIGSSKISSIEYRVPLWFLMCLFVVFNIYYFFKKVIKKNIYLFVIIILVIIILENGFKEYIEGVQFYLHTSLIAILFFYLGNIFKEGIIKLSHNFLFFVVNFYIFKRQKFKCFNVRK